MAKVNINVKIESEMKKYLEELAIENKISYADFVKYALLRGIKAHEQDK